MDQFLSLFRHCELTVIILNIGTDRSEQTVHTLIRLLLKEQSDQGLLCLLFCLHLLNTISVLPRNFITGDNVPGLLKKWGHLRKKRGHCGENDGPVIWRSKISLPSVYIITDHTLTVINNLLTT